MESLAREILAPYFGSFLSPGALAVATVFTLVIVSGLGALAIERFESVGGKIRRQLGQSFKRTALPDTRWRSIALVRRARLPEPS